MTLFADVPVPFSWRALLPMRSTRVESSANVLSDEEREASCARRAFLNEKMCETAGAIEGEFGIQAMMSVYPKQF